MTHSNYNKRNHNRLSSALIIILVAVFFFKIEFHLQAQENAWDVSTYPDEAGYQLRMAPMIQRIADQGFGTRSLAQSTCPDTGLPVKMWAVEGETIISPYTGTTYTQGPTGYFGPRKREANGEISVFGGDVLKYDLPPATASLLLDPENSRAKAYLSIKGNLRQQYHFACVNWARFYPLLSDKMSKEWNEKFHYWVNDYNEKYKYSNQQERFEITHPHNLVGEEDGVFGGNPRDGGTENHKIMWRTSGLLYSQLLPDSVGVSGNSTKVAERRTKDLLRKFVKQLLTTGNGEYDSNVYYSHSIRGFLNLYDFSPDEETRMLAKIALDYYYATYGLKTIDGMIAGPQNRGYLATAKPSEMEVMQHTYFDNVSRNMDGVATTIHQATTKYRPNKIIWNITRKNLQLPFEGRISRPFMHLDLPFAFAESFYCTRSFAMGNVQMVNVDNPNQQVVWSAVSPGSSKPMCFSSGHPLRASTSGHSPYVQTLHSKGTLLLMTAPTLVLDEVSTDLAPGYVNTGRINLWHLPLSEQGDDFERKNRKVYGSDPLHSVDLPDLSDPVSIDRFWKESKGSASSWFYFPSELEAMKRGEWYFFETDKIIVAVQPITEMSEVIAPDREVIGKLTDNQAKKFFRDYSILTCPGETSGYVVEVVGKEDYPSIEELSRTLKKKCSLDLRELNNDKLLYKSISGETLELHYQPTGLRCRAKIDGKELDFDNYTNSQVYATPYVKIGNGKMLLTDGKDGYEVDYTGELPVFKSLP